MTAPRILVVEDERVIALHLRQQLTKLGYDVPHTVSTGDHALRRIEEALPDLILMDINLKGRMDGITTAAAIPAAYRIPIIYLTAYSADETLARAAATNPHGYILKPFAERELHAMIQMTLARCAVERASRNEAERLHRARKMEALSRLAAGVADEVDDMLTTLYGQLEVIGGHAAGAPALAETVQDVFDEAVEKEHLINRLLEFAERRPLAPTTISLAELMARVDLPLRQVLGRTIQVRVEFPENLWPARIDSNRLVRALVNLLTNAREAMPNGGCLTIEGENTIIDQDVGGGTGRYVALVVTDTGTGMPKQVVERAFEPFFSTRPDGRGRGLGLSLVFGFVRQSGGHISIDSIPGSGTTVRIYLPAATGVRPGVEASDADASRRLAQLDQHSDHVTKTGSNMALNLAVAAPRRRDFDRIDQPASATPDQDTMLPVLWHRAENAMFASVVIPPGQVRYRLIVEPLPRQNGWDWAVWQPGGSGRRSRYGRASSVVSAMAAAEDAARHWVTTGSPGAGLAASPADR
jgi:signal transduction histidine kinase